MKFQAFHVNPGEKLKKKDVNNDLSNFMSVFPSTHTAHFFSFPWKVWGTNPPKFTQILKFTAALTHLALPIV